MPKGLSSNSTPLMKTYLLSIAAILLMASGCHQDRAVLPDELLGSWTTDVPVYRGRSLKLEKEYVLVGFGEDVDPIVQRITKVEVLHDGITNATTIYSADKEGPHQLTVYFEPANGGSLFIKNLPGRWIRR
jgi:hypothetical protein